MRNLYDTIVPPQSTPFEIQIDWEQYFKDFCEAHGKYPVVHDELFLFPDGWRYSTSDYMGPEFPPPTDPEHLCSLQLAYWQRRRQIVRDEFHRVNEILKQVRELTRVKSVPLKQSILSPDDNGQLLASTTEVDTTLIEHRVTWLLNDLKQCDEKVKLYDVRGQH